MFRIVHSARGKGDWQRLEEWHWQQKLAAREEFVEAMRKLDQRNGRTAVHQSPRSIS